MTPQEALAQALGTVLDYPVLSPDSKPRTILLPSWDEMATAILAALPEGWVLVDVPGFGQYTLDQREYGAQQERERLLAKAFPGLNVAQQFRCVDRSFFADPDDDR